MQSSHFQTWEQIVGYTLFHQWINKNICAALLGLSQIIFMRTVISVDCTIIMSDEILQLTFH